MRSNSKTFKMGSRSRATTQSEIASLEEELHELPLDPEFTDRQFDRIYDENIRNLSKVHWTPVRVARRAAELLSDGPQSKILDVGSGPGKFCLVGALSTDALFFGIERRKLLFDLSGQLAKRYKVSRAQFILGDAAELDWSGFDGFYLYNPFYENISDPIRFEPLVALSEDRYKKYVAMTQAKLRDLPEGTRVVTFHGFGGELPLAYRLSREERFRDGILQLWVKQASDLEVRLPPEIWSEY